MSQIDQAFIHAYTNTESPAAPSVSPLPGNPMPAPHIVPHPETQTPAGANVVSMAAEPIPAPHFQAAGAVDSYLESAAVDTIAVMPSQASPSTERRPLSTFSSPQQPATVSFDPVFEVDAFRWPTAVDDLLREHHTLLSPVVEQLLAAREAGRTMVGIAGTRSGVGCTTVLLCLSRMLAQAGLQVAIVDGYFAQGDLAAQLGLEFDTGWEDALSGRVPLAETVVKSLDDRLALLPLNGPNSAADELLAGIQTSITAGVLRYHYDMVLFDLGTAGQSPQYQVVQQILQHCRLDASLVVADSARDMSSESINQLLELLGNTCHGVIGNHTL